jgi:putative membrane protein
MNTIGFFFPRFAGRIWMFERFGWLGMVLSVLFWVAIISLIIGLIRRSRRHHAAAFMSHRPTSPNDPLEIARTRYAKGEITKEQFEQLKNDLK